MPVTVTLPMPQYLGRYPLAGLIFVDGVATAEALTDRQAAALALVGATIGGSATTAPRAKLPATLADLDAAVAAAIADRAPDDLPPVGQYTFPRQFAIHSIAVTSGQPRVAYLTARRTETVANVRAYSGGTAAAATPTLQRLGVYSIAADGALTLLAATTNDTATLFRTASTGYTKALAAPVNLVAGTRYAIVSLVVTTAATPTVVGLAPAIPVADAAAAPPLSHVGPTGLTDLPATITAAQLGQSTNRMLAGLLP